MTIIEAIKEVLKDEPEGLSSADIYQRIIDKNLYKFGAKNPVGVVNGEIRRHCVGLEFPTAYPVKHFAIAGKDGKKLKFIVSENNKLKKNENQATNIDDDNAEFLPEEKIVKAIDEHLHQIKQQLLDNIMSNHPDFFEQLVVELLLKMGYGYDKNSGIVTGGSHDNGIDGIISEDKLGLDKILIQAKRYSPDNTVGCPAVQQFVGAITGQGASKGVFFTTSSFSKEALNYKAGAGVKLVLIDGKTLASYMIEYNVGVSVSKVYEIKRLDSDYFEE